MKKHQLHPRHKEDFRQRQREKQERDLQKIRDAEAQIMRQMHGDHASDAYEEDSQAEEFEPSSDDAGNAFVV